MIKLHLGCGTKHIEGFTNIDIRYLPGVDEVNNIRFLRNYKNDSVDLIYACHVLEHFSRWEYKNALTRWYEILKPGGVLRLAVPNFTAIASRYIQTGNLQEVMGLLYGGQDYDENYHFVTFDMNSMRNDLTNIGFSSIAEYDHKLTEHALIDDFSQAYLPHLDPNGTLMSLNIQAVK
jgi:predicted SAM-dependent methyltransferase